MINAPRLKREVICTTLVFLKQAIKIKGIAIRYIGDTGSAALTNKIHKSLTKVTIDKEPYSWPNL